jgi:peptidoglycan/LPS O-acetylase OafA/YrhL
MLQATKNHLARNAALDRLRACAIISVVVYHVVQMSPVSLPTLGRVTWYGQYGVDLFFVLSGWLIGGLYWREARAAGAIDVPRFWVRRWMRTMPPYFLALIFSWFAVRFGRNEPFDPHYLVFLQNYYERIPFFLVSWSLCIEEHFYLMLPFVAGALIAFVSRRLFWLAWVALLCLSPLFRWLEGGGDDFGYSTTATHLRLDGLVLGVGLSYIALFVPIVFDRFARWSLAAILVCVVGLAALELVGGLWQAIFWPTAVALLCGAVVVSSVSHKAAGKDPRNVERWAITMPWKTIAITSYSAYLVHPLAIHVARKLVSLMGPLSAVLYWPVVCIIVVCTTAIFYRAIERPSILLRDAWTPSRLAVLRAK